jgi:RNA polymerase sigma-70 factor, ECF subfamily
MNDLDAASIRAQYDEHGAALWRYAVRLTGDRDRAEACTSTAKPATGERGLVRDEEASARVRSYEQFRASSTEPAEKGQRV